MKVTISGFYDEVSFKLDEQIAVLKELGEKYMCPRNIDGRSIASFTAEEFAANIKPKLDANGVRFSSIGSPIGKIDINDNEAFDVQLGQLKELIKICQMMDCKYIRIFSFFMPKDCDPAKYRDAVMAKMRKFVECVEGTDVILLHENEKEIYGDTDDRALDVYKTINSPGLKLIYDASNFIQVGVDPNAAYEKLKDYVVYYHMKDCNKDTRVEMPLGMGSTDYPAIFADLEARGYEGFMTLEPHTAKYAILRKFVTFVPFAPVFFSRYFMTFMAIDKKLKKNFFSKVTRKEVFVLQYNLLKEFIEKAGK